MTDRSYRQILRSSSIIGGASVINIVVGLFRIKVAAVLLGPAGIGLIGLLTSLAGTASTLAGLGLGTVGTRQIAEAAGREDAVAMAAARRALFWSTLTLALLGAAIIWTLRGFLAARVLGDVSLAGEVGWLAVVVALTVAAVSQSALLNGMHRIGDLARASVLSALLSTLLGVGALLLWGRGGLMAFVIAVPLASFLLGHVYVAGLPKIQVPHTPIKVLVGYWRNMAMLGAAVMMAGLVATVGQLLLRTLVQTQLGADALGYYQAASTISLTYIGFVLAAMSTDYYPRLTAAIHDPATVNRMVNEQTEVAFLLAGPIFLAMIGLAPWAIELLYSHNFHPAADVLRWMVLGDIFKVASWPLGYILLAAGDGRTFLLTEALAMGVFVLLAWLGIPWFGVVAVGMAFLGAYMALLPVLFWLARHKTGFAWEPIVGWLVGGLLLATAGLTVAAQMSPTACAISGLFMSLALGFYSFCRLAKKTNVTGRLGRFSMSCQRRLTKLGMRPD